MAYYRTRTYIAAEWDGDSDAVAQLRKWNDSNYWSLSFTDAHELMQARDGSLKCSIKKSLSERLNASKTFVLIVGNNTKNVRNGSCQYCGSYNSYPQYCTCGASVDYRSYIEYECQKAVRDNDSMKLVVLYNAATVDKNKCPDSIKAYGTHVPMKKMQNGQHEWDYESVKKAMGQ